MSKRLDDLLKKQEQIKTQIQQVRSREAKTQRKEDTRRKVLIGAAILESVEKGKGGWTEAKLKSLMDGFLTRSLDRKLFGLSVNDSEDDNSEDDDS